MTTTDILALTAVIVSVISIVATVAFSWLQQKHNKNSVRPICEIRVNDYENKLGVYLANYGTGSLIIREISCKDVERISSSLITLMPKITQAWTTFTENVTGWAIPVGGKIALIELRPTNDENKESIRVALMQITIEVTYTDIYEKTEFKASRNLSFFGRNIIGYKSPYPANNISYSTHIINSEPLKKETRV
jgi:hypothetical protein